MPNGRYSYDNGTLASNETIFSAISMLAGAIASAPITLRQEFKRVLPEDHPVAAMLEYGVNPNMTTFQFIRCMETLRDSTGAGYAIREFDDGGNTVALWPVQTSCVMPLVDRDSRELYYRVRDDTSGQTAYLHNSLVIAVGHISSNGERPINPIDVLRSSLDYDRKVKEFSVNQMENGLHAHLFVRVPTALDKAQTQSFLDTLRIFRNSGILVLDKQKEITELKGGSVIDPKVFEAENITIARVARVFNIPLEKFLPDKTSYSSAEQGDLNYLRDTILPMARMYEQEFSRKLLSEQERGAGMQIKFSLNGFARADMKTRGDFYMKGVRTGWFCLDDVRGMEDLPEIPGGVGREFFISRDLVPVKDFLESGNPESAGIGSGEQIAQLSLNSTQINSILQVVQAATNREMEYEAAVTLLVSAFPFDRTTAIQLLGSRQREKNFNLREKLE